MLNNWLIPIYNWICNYDTWICMIFHIFFVNIWILYRMHRLLLHLLMCMDISSFSNHSFFCAEWYRMYFATDIRQVCKEKRAVLRIWRIFQDLFWIYFALYQSHLCCKWRTHYWTMFNYFDQQPIHRWAPWFLWRLLGSRILPCHLRSLWKRSLQELHDR